VKKRIILAGSLFALFCLFGLFFLWYTGTATPHTPIAIRSPAPPAEELSSPIECPNTFVSWNLGNFGAAKTDEAIEIMAQILSSADIVAIQEVTAGKDHGAQAVAKLADALSRTGVDWDYVISDPTQPRSPGVERYAFLFKKKSVTINRRNAHLVAELETPIDREPFALTFELTKSAGVLTVFTIHTVPTAKHPISEVAALTEAAELRNAKRAIVAGDFNLAPKATDPYFSGIGLTGHVDVRTSLATKLHDGRYVAKQYDNIYTKGVTVCTAGTIDFVGAYFAPVTDDSLGAARKVSDHLPVYVTFQ